MRKLLVLIAALAMVCITLTGGARADNGLELKTPRVTWAELVEHVGVLRDPGRDMTLEEALAATFVPVEGRSADFGYTRDVIWLKLRITNALGPEELRLRVSENFFQLFEVYTVASDGTISTLITQDEGSDFASRPIPYPELLAGFEMRPGETLDLYIRFWSGGSSEISFDVMTRAAFEEWAAGKTAKNFIYYGMMLFLTFAAVACFLGTRRVVFLAYAIYASFGLLFIMHADGNTFKYLWPGAPGFNSNATVLLGGGLILGGANFAREFLQTYVYHPILEKILLAVMAAVIATMLAALVVDPQVIKQLLVLQSLIAVLTFTGSGLVAARTRFREVRFYVLAWSGAVISSAIMNMRHLLGIEISEEVQFDSMRIVFVLDAALMGFAIVDRFNQLRRNRRIILEKSLVEAERNVTLSSRLQELEGRYRLLEELEAARQRTLADTAHDLRQPLHALRANVRALVSRTDGRDVDVGEVEDMFRYLEGLVSSGLETAHISGAGPEAGDAQGCATQVGEILEPVAEMFADDAADKGLSLRVVDTRAECDVPPLVLMRIVSNLVSNAVKYTDTGGVLLGVRRRAGRLWVEVHDTGPGMKGGDFQRAVERAQRLDDTAHKPGSGLGLAIVDKLVRDHALVLEHATRTGSGSVVRVSVT